jgi:hypothetical protein
MTDPTLATVNAELIAAIRHAWDVCERLDEGPVRPGGPRAGVNLPELLREACEQVARDVGGVEAFVRHRPGSWEADVVRRLLPPDAFYG